MLEGIDAPNTLKDFIVKDGTRIFYREWPGRKKDVILYLSGLQSHMGWFVETGDLLNRHGFHIYAVDRRGSGMSKVDRGHMKSFSVLIDDVKEFIELAKSRYPDGKIYLMGVCWGSKIAVMLTAYHQKLIDGLILFSPAIKTKVNLSLRQKIDVMFSNIFNPHKLLDVPLEDCMFTDNQKYLEFIKKDPLKLTKATARFFFETARMNRRLDGMAQKIHIPLLVLLAGNDVIVDNEGVKKWVDKISSSDKTIKLYPHCCHGLQFEEEISDITNHIAHWIDAHSSCQK